MGHIRVGGNNSLAHKQMSDSLFIIHAALCLKGMGGRKRAELTRKGSIRKDYSL